ncbi:MAG: hypothetical protein CL844_03315 [Crocinitomicaceae bacterium]|nr:hypothetical protein [Crocinitomicaceae bacterium]|tara:strand:+ start:85055 stop:85939 length:885 start_codon:yes stop_codon:yes gene_type:complete
MENKSDIKALVQLCDDPDENIYNQIKHELISYGKDAIPFLEESWIHNDYDLLFQSRIEKLIPEIQYNSIKNDLKTWINKPNKSLLEGALLIASYQYPNINKEKIRSEIKYIRDSIWLELNDRQTAFEKVTIFNKIFYGQHKFIGDKKNYNSPMNSYLNTVIETRKGNPLSLSILYSLIAQSLKMPIFGVNLPNHFILTYIDENKINNLIKKNNNHGTLFYINAFSKGTIFEEMEIDSFLKKINLPYSREYYEPCSNSTIIYRMLSNLINSHKKNNQKKRVRDLTELKNLFNRII